MPRCWDFDAASAAVAVGTVDSGDETLMYEIGWQYTHNGYGGFAELGGPVRSGISAAASASLSSSATMKRAFTWLAWVCIGARDFLRRYRLHQVVASSRTLTMQRAKQLFA
eukprot:SAG31_NODE_62_length_28678_cov_21.548270_24_plen_111_part_00